MIDLLTVTDNFKRTKGVLSKCIIEGDVASPFVTIAIPTFQRAKLLRETIDSALNQKTDVDYDILVVDNNPVRNDETEILLQSYDDKRISYFKNDQNIGSVGNWNRLYTLAKGEWVVMIHDDDLLCINYLEDVIKYMREDVDVISGDFFPFDKNPVLDTSSIQTTAVTVPFERLWNSSVLVIAGLAIRKKSIFQIGGFNPKFQNFDCVLITQLAYYGKAVKITKPLAPYRIQQNASQNKTVFEKCIKQEAERNLFVLKQNLPSWLANIIQIDSTLTLVDSWNSQFKVKFKSPLYANVGFFKRKISHLVGRIYSFMANILYPMKSI